MSNPQQINHWRTTAGIIVCTLAVLLATPLVRLPIVLMGWVGSWWPELVSGILAGYLAMEGTLKLVRGANSSVVAYAVTTIYLCLLLGLLAFSFSTGAGSAGAAVILILQIIGQIGGIWMAKQNAW